MARKRSIHIGINVVDQQQYLANTPPTLYGCENDALALMDLASATGFDSRCLLTEDATSERVLAVLREHADLLEGGDQLLLSYAGHGSCWTDNDSDEDDKQDETWVLYDRQLFDDEIRIALARFRQGVRILIISDSCHSGTVTRGAPPVDSDRSRPRSRSMPSAMGRMDREVRKELYDRALASAAAAAGTLTSRQAAVVLFAACQDDQLANEEPSGHGRFTNAVVETWSRGKFEGDLEAFFENVASRVRDQTPKIDPQGEAVDEFLRSRPFGVDRSPSPG